MNIWTGLLFLDGSLPDVDLARELSADAPAPRAAPAAANPLTDHEDEARAAQAEVPLWKPSPGIALR